MNESAQIALCALASAASEVGIEGDVHAFFADAGDGAQVARAVDALALLEPGQSAGDFATWHVTILNRGTPAPNAPAWCAGRLRTLERSYAGQRFRVLSPAAEE